MLHVLLFISVVGFVVFHDFGDTQDFRGGGGLVFEFLQFLIFARESRVGIGDSRFRDFGSS